MAIETSVTIKESTFDQSIIGSIQATRNYTTAVQAGFVPAKYNCVAVDSTDSKLVLYDAANAKHTPIGIVLNYITGLMEVATHCTDVDINKLSIANLAANKAAAAKLLLNINITVL